MTSKPTKSAAPSIQQRLARLPLAELQQSLYTSGFAVTPRILTDAECDEIAALYPHDELFRSHVIMQRLRFGRGDYKYFAAPLPPLIVELRTNAYPHLAEVANAWAEQLGADTRFPATHAEFLQQCHRAGQKRPTPLLLHYQQDGYNCLHQDIYGELAFPLQMVIPLGQQGQDWQGGEFVLVEQRPRAQSAVEVLTPDKGSAIFFTTRYRPVSGARGFYRVNIKHGVARVRRGTRYTLGIIFHDAS